ncbi:MAG: Fe-S cluster assembly ATPase SufC [candidate division WOR-3 bacterium]
MALLEIRNLAVSVEGNRILKGVNLTINPGEIHAVMGPNGSGKSTLTLAIMGHPAYSVEEGDILFEGESILELSTDERAKKGIFLAFQHPLEIEGVRVSQMLWKAAQERGLKISPFEFRKILKEAYGKLKMEDFIDRYLNVGFSGGEKKRSEVAQLLTLKPKLAILDEIDSGLDIDAVKLVGDVLTRAKEENPNMSMLIITHYQRILNFIKPDYVHVMVDGRIVKSGGFELSLELEEKGYESLLREVEYAKG